MDLFLLGTVLFLLANVAVVVRMLGRVNLNNDSVLAWEQAQIAATQPAYVQPRPVSQYQPDYMAKAA
ncbi:MULTISPECIES: hypothetical protein [unclassified Rheinheimera]|jgi:hypothetical protein|uniref:hypothetical protein n=1 Tax=unclassified Rheinheimera TaxID=115860 RepID=UPI002735DF88|nr:hypothetical protein [Rheinheimera sp.]MDP2714303.1 hypothetical protein [Rheinheimera sp.]